MCDCPDLRMELTLNNYIEPGYVISTSAARNHTPQRLLNIQYADSRYIYALQFYLSVSTEIQPCASTFRALVQRLYKIDPN